MNRVQLCDDLPDKPGYYYMLIGPEYYPEIIECKWKGGSDLYFLHNGGEGVPCRIMIPDVRGRWTSVRFSKQIILEECRWFLNWLDDTPRDEMRREMLAEVTATIESRTQKESV